MDYKLHDRFEGYRFYNDGRVESTVKGRLLIKKNLKGRFVFYMGGVYHSEAYLNTVVHGAEPVSSQFTAGELNDYYGVHRMRYVEKEEEQWSYIGVGKTQVSDRGNVRYGEVQLSRQFAPPLIRFIKNGKWTTSPLARMVYNCFVFDTGIRGTILYLDGNSDNVRASNMYWDESDVGRTVNPYNDQAIGMDTLAALVSINSKLNDEINELKARLDN